MLSFFLELLSFFLEFSVFFHLEFFSKCPNHKPDLVCAEIRWKTNNNSNGITSITGGELDKKENALSSD